ncbi:WD40-repeat-containing domain protein [Leucosporidium creatinivorum]|uniref:WD40-repeat-containing domain protein n=1 Tax=Leucosporidium creatinivorum TaxID=106004 RepID=A0A1Y2G5C1_9BASI|nr:WD40-repeat-containing domain protein [Leucosporidium creatinivorum]
MSLDRDEFRRRVRSAAASSSPAPSPPTPTTSQEPPRLVPSSSNSRISMRGSLSGVEDPFAATSGSSSWGEGTSGLGAYGNKKKLYGDRFIPTREGADSQTSFKLIPSAASLGKRRTDSGMDAQKDEADRKFDALLRTELFGPEYVDQASLRNSPSTRIAYNPSNTSSPRSRPGSHEGSPTATPISGSSKPVFSFSSPSRKRTAPGDRERVIGGAQGLDSPTHERYSTSPVKYEGQRVLLSPRKAPRLLAKVPFKVLDAPQLADDYYLNLVDWSSTNILAVGLGADVYLWSAVTSQVTKLCDLAAHSPPDFVTSLSWIGKGNQLAVGTKLGKVHIYDAVKLKCIRTMTGHSARVGALAWNDAILSSGSHDRLIIHRDVRVAAHSVGKITAHRQEVCGLKWNTAENQLASGGNDNRLFVFDKMNETPTHRFTEHIAAVKAIAWSPHQHGILASGGGTADMRLCFRNTATGSLLSEVDTGSQICNLLWSKNSNELVSTHGFSAGQAQNQVCIWRYGAQTQQVATLQGHSYRVLYLAMSPDGETIVTGAGDETLRFWNAFPSRGAVAKQAERTVLNPLAGIR